MQVITVFVAKGGAGKTTISAHLLGALALRGDKTLGIDLNPQAHFCANLGVEKGEAAAAWTMGLASARLEEMVVQARPSAWLLPANDLLTMAEAGVLGAHKPVTDFRQRVRRQWDGDAVIFDTSDHGYFSEMAIAAADVIVIPVPCRAKDVSAFAPTVEVIHNVREKAGLPPAKMLVVPNMYDRRNAESEFQLRSLTATRVNAGAVATLPVPIAVDIDRAGKVGKLLWEAFPSHQHAAMLRRDLAAGVQWAVTGGERVYEPA
jgi:chromosome partitioning protein